ncbi:hypothetical protein BDV97DRAFT_121746 [Delphinella strobiligena]|nr:hypothetical protein BDV97DRAFT_121746 [Delphinella strobiligena]
METDAKSRKSSASSNLAIGFLLVFFLISSIRETLSDGASASMYQVRHEDSLDRALSDRGLDFNPHAHDLWMALLDKFSRQLAVVVQDHTGPQFCTCIEYSIKKKVLLHVRYKLRRADSSCKSPLDRVTELYVPAQVRHRVAWWLPAARFWRCLGRSLWMLIRDFFFPLRLGR